MWNWRPQKCPSFTSPNNNQHLLTSLIMCAEARVRRAFSPTPVHRPRNTKQTRLIITCGARPRGPAANNSWQNRFSKGRWIVCRNKSDVLWEHNEERERELGAGFIHGSPLRQLTAIKSECDSSHRQAPSGDSDHRYQHTLTSLCFITGRTLLMISNNPPAVRDGATAEIRTCWLLMRCIFY